MSDCDKDLQLLGQAPAPLCQPDIQHTITALQTEIARGEAIYSSEELRYLERKLAENEELLRTLTTG
jgi:hypothetical protein